MEIEPATLGQVRRGRGGRLIEIDEDVGNIAAQLREIDPGLRLRYSEAGDYFAVYHDDGHQQYLVFTATEVDGRIIDRMRKVASERYSAAEEAEQMDDQAIRDRDHRLSEATGELHERLRVALLKDLGENQSRVFIPKGLRRG